MLRCRRGCSYAPWKNLLCAGYVRHISHWHVSLWTSSTGDTFFMLLSQRSPNNSFADIVGRNCRWLISQIHHMYHWHVSLWTSSTGDTFSMLLSQRSPNNSFTDIVGHNCRWLMSQIHHLGLWSLPYLS